MLQNEAEKMAINIIKKWYKILELPPEWETVVFEKAEEFSREKL